MRISRSLLQLSAAVVLACLLAALAPHEHALAAPPARSIIPQLQEQFGLNQQQVRGALGALLAYALEWLPNPVFDPLAQRIPNAERAMHDVKRQGIVMGPLDNRAEYEA